MSRNLGIIIIIFALLPIIIYFIVPNTPYDNSEFDIDQNDKTTMLDYSYVVLDNYFKNNNSVIENFETLNEPNLKYNILFVTIFNNEETRGCQSGSTKIDNKDRIFLDIKEAVIESIEDERFGGVLQEEELPNVEIMFTFLNNISWLYNNSFLFLQNNIELGVHSIEFVYNDTYTIFKESVPISNNYDLRYTLERLCDKANLNKNCYLDKDVEIYRYDTFTFMGNRNHKIIDLYRYNIIIDINEINNKRIFDSISLGYDWFLETVNSSTNLLEYMYFPSENIYSTENNHLRQLASLWTITEMNSFLNKNASKSLVNSTLDYYLSFMKSSSNFSYVILNDKAKLANNAFLILTLLNTPHYQNQKELLTQLGNGILSLQNENGSYKTFFFSDENTGIDYYPGEAMLSLMKLYNNTKDQRYLDSVEKAFYHYRDYWRNNKNTALIPWHTQTYKLLFEETKNQDLSDFIFEMNDWMIDNYQINTSEYPDEIGGFPKYYPTFSTSVFIEGINDAYSVAMMVNDSFHIQKYKEAIRLGTRFILQIQFTENNTFYLNNDIKAIGGFKTSLTNNGLRIDNTQHSMMALMKTYENEIFN